MINDIDREFNSKEEAERVANIYNMGSDSDTAFVMFNGKNWIITRS